MEEESIWMVTVVKQRDVITRICVDSEERARATLRKLRALRAEKNWLAVTLAIILEHPHRSSQEMDRVADLIALLASGQ